MRNKRQLLDEYRLPGFHPKAKLKGIFGDPKAKVITLKRTQKKQYVAHAARFTGAITTRQCAGFGIYPAGMREYIWKWRSGESSVGSAGK